MPIKFRCKHCRQFLGISRAKAEQVVDCPTCGRSIRVPSLEGKVAPLPAPKLDLKDESLVAALERLANIGGEAEGDIGARLVLAGDDAPQDESDDALDDSLAPVAVREPEIVAAPEPIDPPPMQRPLPAEIVEPTEGLQPAGVPSSGGRSRSERAPDTLSELAAESASARSQRSEPRTRRAIPWIAVGATLLVALGAGFLAGRWSAPTTEAVTKGEVDSSTAEQAAPPLPPDLREAITGRVMYKTDRGDTPDVGACVIALPVERGGTIRLSTVGLRPGDSSEDWRVARAGLRALGGDASVVDSNGNYSIALPLEAGTYQLLVLSRYQGRDADAGLPREVEATLSRYFEAPRQLVGQRRYEFDRGVRWNGTAIVEWGHTFPAEES